ncbi:hypothetical protein C8R43DRAFT_1023241 [Mycena crocata]|nr:hypothetical protein C8R43DRAFT_1023241 [Mycena crocata]
MASTLFSLLVFAASVYAESHTVKFDNRCGYGTPQLIKGGEVLTTTSYTSKGELAAAIAYLQTGSCGFNGEQCTLLEMTMTNPLQVGGGSSADISLIEPHTFSVPTRIEFYGGCDGIGTTCASRECTTAFKQPDDTWVQVACQDDDANLLIIFCPGEASSSSSNTTVQTSVAGTSRTKAELPITVDTSISRSASPTTTTSFSSTSASICKHKRSERRAMSAHRKRIAGGRGFLH